MTRSQHSQCRILIFLSIVVLISFLVISKVSKSLLENELLKPFASFQTFYSIDDVINFDQCSIYSSMPLSIGFLTSGKKEQSWAKIIEKVAPKFVKKKNQACLTFFITDGIFDQKKISSNLNYVIFNIGQNIEYSNVRGIMIQEFVNRSIDMPISLKMINLEETKELPQLLPLKRLTWLTSIFNSNDESSSNYFRIFKKMSKKENSQKMKILDCGKLQNPANCSQETEYRFESSQFCFIPPSAEFSKFLLLSLKSGCIPIILQPSTSSLPFREFIDWRYAIYSLPSPRLTEIVVILSSLDTFDLLEMKRKGRVFFETFFSSQSNIVRAIISSLRFQLQIPLSGNSENIFNTPRLHHISESLADSSQIINSPDYRHNFSEFQQYSHQIWNHQNSPHRTKQFQMSAFDPPAGAELHNDTMAGFRKMRRNNKCSQNLDGNRQEEQFTIVFLTFNRDLTLNSSIEQMNNLLFLNKIIVVWNNIEREPPKMWAKIHVPVEFVKVSQNSLNNRFFPWSSIKTEAVFTFDDDILIEQERIIKGFRTWRENRDRLVGFPERTYVQTIKSLIYSSKTSCQFSFVLTGAVFLHKEYLYIYTYEMSRKIWRHVEKIKNCEDLAMNFLVAHLTRKPPINIVSDWKVTCRNCGELSLKKGHYSQRTECIKKFIQIYGYNPLRYTQHRTGF